MFGFVTKKYKIMFGSVTKVFLKCYVNSLLWGLLKSDEMAPQKLIER